MTPIRRLFATFLGLFFLAVPVYFGVQSQTDSRFLLWFGISLAILVPLGLKLFGCAFRSQDTLVKRLVKVPEIHTLMEQAETYEERVKLLTEERARLEEIVRVESHRQALRDRIGSLERDASRILEELDELDREVSNLDQEIEKSTVSEEIRQLRERVEARRRGDVVVSLGARRYRIDREIIRVLPLGDLLLGSLYFGEWLTRRAKTRRANWTNKAQ